MIPSQIFNAYIMTENGKKLEIRALDMSPDFFDFRVVSNCKLVPDECIELNFWNYESGKYSSYTLKSYDVKLVENTVFYDVYRVSSDDRVFKAYAKELLEGYENYVELKLEDDEELLMVSLTGLELDKAHISDNFDEQWKNIYKKYFEKTEFNLCGAQLALCIDKPVRYKEFLEKPAEKYKESYFEKYFPANIELKETRLEHVYIGNQFCFELLPSKNDIQQLLCKALEEGLKVSFMLPPINEDHIDKIRDIAAILVNYMCEIVVNDIGTLSMLRDIPNKKVIGIFFNRRRKDSRMKWKKYTSDGGEAELKKASLNDRLLTEELVRKYKVSGAMSEALDYEQEIPSIGMSALLFPLYQTNTAPYCTLYAQCTKGSRGKQTEVVGCPKFCQKCGFIYPDILNMVGIGNSLFGICTHYYEEAQKKGQIDRVVFNL